MFSTCTSLTAVMIPNSVTSIGDSAFEWCTSLTKFTIPYSVTTIENGAFWSCTNLTQSIWSPAKTNTLAGGLSYFSDTKWPNYPACFYHLHSP